MPADDALAAAYAEEQAAIVADMQAVGVLIERLPQLLDVRLPPQAMQPLLAHLHATRTHAAREFLIRALGDRTFAGKLAPELAALFLDDDYAAHRWTIGQALATVVTPDDAPLIIDLARRREYGRDREMIVIALGKLKSREADRTLLELLDDEAVAGHAVRALASMSPTRLRELDLSRVQAFKNDRRAWVRRAATAALKKKAAVDPQ